jgi:hypothetical protein
MYTSKNTSMNFLSNFKYKLKVLNVFLHTSPDAFILAILFLLYEVYNAIYPACPQIWIHEPIDRLEQYLLCEIYT